MARPAGRDGSPQAGPTACHIGLEHDTTHFNQMRLPRRPAAIVFDMDGLLFDTETLYQEAAILAAADGGHDVSSGVFSQTIGLPWPQSRALLLAHFGPTFPVEDFVARWVRHFEEIGRAHV